MRRLSGRFGATAAFALSISILTNAQGSRGCRWLKLAMFVLSVTSTASTTATKLPEKGPTNTSLEAKFEAPASGSLIAAVHAKMMVTGSRVIRATPLNRELNNHSEWIPADGQMIVRFYMEEGINSGQLRGVTDITATAVLGLFSVSLFCYFSTTDR